MAKPMYYWNGTAWEAVAPVVPQSPIAYQASAPSSPSTGDLWIDSDQDLDSYQRQLVRYRFNPSAGATSVSGVDANGATLSYTPGAEQVYLNGALLVRGSDYVATNGTSITSLAALSSGDVIEVFAYVAFNPANTYTQSQVDGLVAPMGLVHIQTTDFSGAVSHSFGSDASPIFTSNYTNYKIVLDNLSVITANNDISLRLRANTTDLTGSVYDRQFLGVNGTSVTGARVAAQSLWYIGSTGFAANEISTIIIELQNPQTARRTTYLAENMAKINGVDVQYLFAGGQVTNTNQYNGFTIFGTNNFSGTMSVYGYKK